MLVAIYKACGTTYQVSPLWHLRHMGVGKTQGKKQEKLLNNKLLLEHLKRKQINIDHMTMWASFLVWLLLTAVRFAHVDDDIVYMYVCVECILCTRRMWYVENFLYWTM